MILKTIDYFSSCLFTILSFQILREMKREHRVHSAWCKNMPVLCRPTVLFFSNANNHGSTYLYCMHQHKQQNGILCQRPYEAQADDSDICSVNVLWCILNQKENLSTWYLSINTEIELLCKIDSETVLAFFSLQSS